MKTVKKLLNRLYLAYAGLIFFIPTIIIIPIHGLLSVFPPVKRLPIIYRVHRIWVGTWEILTGLRFQVTGRENLDPGKTYVFVANHTNMLDIPMVGSRIYHPWVSLIKKELKYIPLVGYIIGLIAIPVDRSNAESRQASLISMVQTLRKGISILIFPEGTRNSSKHPLKRFFPGAFNVAIKAQVPILPMVITHSRPMNPPRTLDLYPGKSTLHILPEISTEGKSEKDIAELKQEVFDILETFLIEHDPAFSHLNKEITA